MIPELRLWTAETLPQEGEALGWPGTSTAMSGDIHVNVLVIFANVIKGDRGSLGPSTLVLASRGGVVSLTERVVAPVFKIVSFCRPLSLVHVR